MAILYDVPFSEYLAMPGVHFSTLRYMSTSPLHYVRACDGERHDTASLRMGRLVHSLVLTPDIPPDVVVFDGKARRGKAWVEFASDAISAGKLVVRKDELEMAERMRRAVLSNAQARALLKNGAGELTVTWDEHFELSGVSRSVRCRGRLDWRGAAGIVELKTTRWPSVRAWTREVAARSYHVQLAHYRSGVEANTGVSEPVWWIVVENQPPHDVAVYRVRSDDVEAGDRTRLGWLRRVAECEASGRWPGVGGDEPLEFVLPDYAATAGLEDVDMSSVEEREVAHG